MYEAEKAGVPVAKVLQKGRKNRKTSPLIEITPENQRIIRKGSGNVEKFLFAVLAACTIALLAILIIMRG
jgi:hypothetical protein